MAREEQRIQSDSDYSVAEDWDLDFPITGPEPEEEFTLESILAEYKGTAYIDGDKKTPRTVLQQRTDKIVQEVRSGRELQSPDDMEPPPSKASGRTGPIPKVSAAVAEPVPDAPVPSRPRSQDMKAPTGRLPDISAKTRTQDAKAPTGRLPDISAKTRSQDVKAPTGRLPDVAARPDKDVISLDQIRPESQGRTKNRALEVEEAIDGQTQFEEETIRSVGKTIGLFHRGGRHSREALNETYPEDEEIVEEEVFEEPDFHAAVKKFALGCNTYSMRSFLSLVLSIVMAILTLVFEAGPTLPLVGSSQVAFTGILLVFLFLVMMLSIDKLIQGFKELFGKGPGVEALNLMSCLATSAAAVYSIASQNTSFGMPYCVISAFSLTFTLWGEKIYYRALTETMKTAVAVSEPTGVIAEISQDLGKTVIKKASGRTAGFYNNLIQADVSEVAYKFAAPILIVASIALGFYASIGHGLTKNVLHNIAAVMAAAAPFSAMMTFAIPFSAVSKRARRSGAAIAGWGGADDIFHSDGASITDEDLFPPGTVSLGGIKIFEEVSPEKAVRYTASLIIASNCGLTKLFSEHLSKQGMNLIRVEDFSCYEGGIGGMIRGERVIAGSAAFMNLMGIRVPASLNVKNAIFTAVNKKLIAVFAINYVPTKTVQSALFSVLRYRVKLFFAMRDFNITPVMLEQKYRVPSEAVEYIPIQDSYDISDTMKHEAKRVSAILTREGLGPFVEAVTGGRRLRSTSLVNTVFSLLSAVIGMLLMFIICWTGSFSAASAGNLMLYMLAMLFVVLLISGFARFRQ